MKLQDYSKVFALRKIASKHLDETALERPQPALILVGECNLKEEGAEVALASLQPCGAANLREYWHVHPTAHGSDGNLCLVKGCAARSFEMAVGLNYDNRGMRNDDHDAVGVVLSLPLATERKVSLPF